VNGSPCDRGSSTGVDQKKGADGFITLLIAFMTQIHLGAKAENFELNPESISKIIPSPARSDIYIQIFAHP
jgi:hypothetical protein